MAIRSILIKPVWKMKKGSKIKAKVHRKVGQPLRTLMVVIRSKTECKGGNHKGKYFNKCIEMKERK